MLDPRKGILAAFRGNMNVGFSKEFFFALRGDMTAKAPLEDSLLKKSKQHLMDSPSKAMLEGFSYD